jgi:hypothetical protein
MPAATNKDNAKQPRRSARVSKKPTSGYSDDEDEDYEEEPTRTRSTRAKKAVNGSKGIHLILNTKSLLFLSTSFTSLHAPQAKEIQMIVGAPVVANPRNPRGQLLLGSVRLVMTKMKRRE